MNKLTIGFFYVLSIVAVYLIIFTANFYLYLPFILIISIVFGIEFSGGRYRIIEIFLFAVLLLLSNLFLAILVGDYEPVFVNNMNLFKGLDFYFIFSVFISMVASAVYRQERFYVRFTYLIFSFIFILIVFYGVFKNGFMDAAIAFRFFAYPFILFLVGIRWGQAGGRLFEYLAYYIGFLYFISIIFEYIFPVLFYNLTNAHEFVSTKFNFGSDFSAIDLFNMNYRKFLNFEYFSNIFVLRPRGLFFHSISTSYFFAFLAIVSITNKRFILFYLFFLGAFISGSKGAIIALLFSVFMGYFFRYFNFRREFAISVAVSLVVIIMIFYIGLIVNNPHSVNITAAFGSLFNGNFIGYGVGFGGVHSSNSIAAFSDTGLGSLIGQFGWFFVIIYIIYISVLNDSFNIKMRFLVFYAVFVLMNSVLQEEGFSPYALGLPLLYLGAFSGAQLVVRSEPPVSG